MVVIFELNFHSTFENMVTYFSIWAIVRGHFLSKDPNLIGSVEAVPVMGYPIEIAGDDNSRTTRVLLRMGNSRLEVA